MDVFGIDHETTYDDWVKTIYFHAESYTPKTNDPKTLVKLVWALLDEVKRHENMGKFDGAYYYVIRCLQIFDKEKTGVDIRQAFPETRQLMKTALDAQSRINSLGLKRIYNDRMQQMRSAQLQRERTIAKQLEQDPSVDFSQDVHLQRQRQLLNNEAQSIDALRAQLGEVSSVNRTTHHGAQIHPTPNNHTPPPSYGNLTHPSAPSASNGTGSHSQQSIRQQISVLPSQQYKPRYERWKYNLANFPLQAARRGIVNLGNTCYMNSVLQVINGTPLADFFMKNEYQNFLVLKAANQVKVVNGFIFVIRELRRPKPIGAVSASPFRSAVGEAYEPFRSSSQQDANEFLRVLLDTVHTALNEKAGGNLQFPEIDNTHGTDLELSRKYWGQYLQRNLSVVSELCGFQERSMLVCPSCGHTSRSFSTSYGVDVPVAQKSRIAVEDCLAAYTAEEMLDRDSLYSCAGCKKKVRATKRIQLYSTPKILFITLKRFRAYGDFSNVSKITDEVFFERALDLSPFMCSDFSKTQFNLVGVVNHSGNMHGGHYTADVLGSDKVWCNFSDERVLMAEQPDFRQAYILCYVRTS